MTTDPRWDPEMLTVLRALEEAAAAYPVPAIRFPMEPQRAVNDLLGIAAAGPGPEVASVRDIWVPARGRRVQVRLYMPPPHPALPAAVPPLLVYFHGGGWVWSSIDTHDKLARELCLGGGVAVASVDYALAPEARFPQALDESAIVVRQLRDDAAALGFDPARMGVGGDSAGGNLALSVALMLRDGGGPALRGMLAIYPVTDADFSNESYTEFAEGFGLTRQKMEEFWDMYAAAGADRMNPLAVPLRAELAGLPPTLVQLAEIDVLRSEGEALAAKLAAAGVPARCTTYPGVAHGFMRHTRRLAKARDAVAEAGTWLKETL